MLVFTRKSGQKIRIGDDIEITVLEIRKGSVKIGIKAPKGLMIHREEVYQKILQENIMAARSAFNSDVQLDDTKIKLNAESLKEKKDS
ncbi:MAG: carbon storage regulator CsrA [Thermodesulfobacteria bacterium]|nr:carbon storage regulator CsrA [Thermodesulfobacteriota bacterium]